MNKFTDRFMDATVVNKIPVASLFPDRYGLGKTKIYEYLSDLGIKPILENRRSFITFEQLQLLDRYVPVAPDKEAATEFLANLPTEHVREQVHGLVQSDSTPPPWLLLAEAIANLQPAADPLALHRQLEEVVDHGWELSSSQIREILGTCPRDGDRRYGFTFWRCGRIGRQSAWKVEKV